jgi:hypothetical protein
MSTPHQKKKSAFTLSRSLPRRSVGWEKRSQSLHTELHRSLHLKSWSRHHDYRQMVRCCRGVEQSRSLDVFLARIFRLLLFVVRGPAHIIRPHYTVPRIYRCSNECEMIVSQCWDVIDETMAMMFVALHASINKASKGRPRWMWRLCAENTQRAIKIR